VDAALVREFLRTLPDRPNDAGTVGRMRGYLEALGRPDVRYLVGATRGGGAPIVARYARAVLSAAGATVAAVDDPLDEPLIAIAGTSVATIAYQLASSRPELGEPSRREIETLLAFVAHAEASRRVLLLVDEELDPQAPVHGPLPDVIAIGRAADDLVAAEGRATAETLAKNGCPVRTIHLPRLDEESLGELLMHFMLETIIAAHLIGIDAFDQPAVEEGKVLAKKYLTS